MQKVCRLETTSLKLATVSFPVTRCLFHRFKMIMVTFAVWLEGSSCWGTSYDGSLCAL